MAEPLPDHINTAIVGYFASEDATGDWKIIAERADGGLQRVGRALSREAARKRVAELIAALPEGEGE